MRSLIQSTKQWVNKTFITKAAVGDAVTPSPAHIQEHPTVFNPTEVQKPVTANQAPTHAPVITLKKIRVQETDVPKGRPEFPEILFTGGTEIKVISRGNQLYAHCTHCEASWSIRERLLRFRLSIFKMDDANPLTCPACDKAVSLPRSIDTRKLI
jgi:hypothetical protein